MAVPRQGWVLLSLIVLGATATPAAAASDVGEITQLQGAAGCLVDRSAPSGNCTEVRALSGPGPFLGSRAIDVSPDGKNVYVASSSSDAIAVFKRSAKKGTLTQPSGTAGCIAAGGADGCASAVGLDGPNSVAVSPDGDNVYATAVDSDSVTTFSRDPSNGALTQAVDGTGCIAEGATAGCTTGRALDGADVVVPSPDGANVYVGAFFGNAVAAFSRNGSTGALTQPAGEAGCITAAPTPGCVNGIALAAPEGLAISNDGNNVYAATAVSNAVVILSRDPSTGGLTQAADGTGCITESATTGCTAGTQLSGANAVTVSPDDEDAYVTSLFSNSLTSFARTSGTGQLVQLAGTAGCIVHIITVGCGLGQSLLAPEGLTVSPDGKNVYATAFESGAVDIFKRKGSGALVQKPRSEGCVGGKKANPNCTPGRTLKGASSVVVSPDGKYVYVTAFGSSAVDVFKRTTAGN